jgi:hypothetical protein
MTTIINGSSPSVTFSDGTTQSTAFTTGAVTQSTIATGVAGTGPAFSAYQSSAQTLTANAITKLQFQTKEFDTANAFDSTTNYRFTPQVAGYYQVNGAFSATANRTYSVIYLYKNGSNFKSVVSGNSTTGQGTSISTLIYLNGSTDYIEIYALNGVTQNITNSQQETWFQASMVRAA